MKKNQLQNISPKVISYRWGVWVKNELKRLQDNYLTENTDPNEEEEICSLKQKVNTLERENKFLKNDLDSKQKLTTSLLEHNSNLLYH